VEKHRKALRTRAAKRPFKFWLEPMEDRTVPANVTALGPNSLSLVNPGPTTAAQVGNTLYFIGSTGSPSSSLWRTDGTTAGTAPVGAAGLSGLNVTAVATAGGSVFFTATESASGASNVYKLDSTAPSGVTQLTDFSQAPGQNPIDGVILKATGNRLLFEEDVQSPTPTHADGQYLWTTDGTAAGTHSLGLFVHEDAETGSLDLSSAAAVGSRLYFTTWTGDGAVLWTSDGTTAGTRALTGRDSPNPDLHGWYLEPAATSGGVVFFATDAAHGNELWSVNGDSLTPIAQLDPTNPNVAGASPLLSGTTVTDGRAYFLANDGSGRTLWATDGTAAGTRRVLDPSAMPTGFNVDSIANVTNLSGSVDFTSFDATNGDVLWSVTGNGTASAHTLQAGPVSAAPRALAVTNDGLLVFAADADSFGTELWATDGSTFHRLTDLNPGSGSSAVSEAFSLGDTVVAAGSGAPTTQLWEVTDANAPDGATTTTTLTASAATVTFGSPVTLTAMVAANDAATPAVTGQVVFRNSGRIYGTAPLVNGTATLSVTLANPGADTLEAVYTGDATFDESMSPTVTVTAVRTATAVTLTTSDATAEPGQPVTFTATVVPAKPGQTPPSGSVLFFDGTTDIGFGSLANGVATYQTGALSSGAHSITATYYGDTTFAGSTSAPLTQTVGASYTVTLTGPQTGPTFGQPVTLTAHITPPAGNSLPVGASVVFRDGATSLGTAAVDANGNAALTVTNLGVGLHSLTAVFTAGSDFTSNAVAVTVQKAATSASLRSTAPTARQGQAVTLTMTISPPAAGMPAPTGTVTFKDGSAVLGSAPVANGRAVLLVNSLAVGSHPVTATYQGDGNYNGSSANLTQTVTPATAATTTTVHPSVTSAVVGQQVALTATVLPSAGTTKPVGSITFKDGNTVLGAAVLDPTGKAQLLTTSLGAGTHTITATFGGASVFTGSTSAPVTVSVRLGSKTTLAASASAIVATQAVTLTATVGAVPGGAVQPAGSVTFYDGTTAIGTAPIRNGVARFTTAPFTAIDIHRLSAAYAGNSLVVGSSSGVVYLNVRPAGTAITLQAPAPPAAITGIVTLNATVGAIAPATGMPTGKVTFFDGSTVLGSATVAAGKATVQVAKLAAGTHNLRAFFTGTGSYGGSSSAIVRYTVAATTSTAVTAPGVAYGQTTALKATVSVLSPGFGKANGKVTFRDGATVLGSATLLNGVATLGVKLATGGHHLTAAYEGTPAFAASATSPLGYAVAKAAPATILNASPTSPRAGMNVTVRADFGPAAFGAAKPTGTVKLTDGSTILGTFPLGLGPVIFQTSKLTKGTHALTAAYSGDANYLAAAAHLTLTVA
jgi:ELWxxDGT repeat protein